MRGYHFTGDTLRNGMEIPEIGTWLKHEGPLVACKSGLHFSVHPFDALQYAPGPILHRVEVRGELVGHGNPIDKYVGRERKIIASLDMTEPMRYFARQCALSVAHLWDAPDVVLQYLVTGDETIRDTAWAAARAAARDTARDTAWAAAWAAARDAAWAAARAAARDAAWDTARDAAWAAAWDTARDTARDAACRMFAAIVAEAFAEEAQ